MTTTRQYGLYLLLIGALCLFCWVSPWRAPLNPRCKISRICISPHAVLFNIVTRTTEVKYCAYIS